MESEIDMNLNLIEVKVMTKQEAVPAVSNILMEAGAQGVQIDDHKLEDVAVISYFPDDADIKSILLKIRAKVVNLTAYGLNPAPAKVTARSLSDAKWATTWEKYYHAERVTRFLTIVPAWEDYENKETNQIIIKLNPGMAFGTGTHPTTKMAMQALETILRGNETVFDVGTGSGVLAVTSRKLGAGDIFAWDNDKNAVESAKKNIALNMGMQNIQVGINSLLEEIIGTADVIVANMLAEVLLPLVPQAADHLKKGGKFITAGIYFDKLDDMIDELNQHGFVINQVMSVDNWRSIIATKGEN